MNYLNTMQDSLQKERDTLQADVEHYKPQPYCLIEV